MRDAPSTSENLEATHYRNLFMNSSSIMLIIDPKEGKIVDANQSAAKFYGYTRNELIAMNIKQINMLSPDQVQLEMENAKLEKRNFFQFRHKLANGEIRNVDIYSNPVKIDQKLLLYSVIHDVTKQVQLEEVNRELIAQSLESLGSLGADLAHDYNNILQSMMGCIDLLKYDESLSTFSKEVVDTLDQAVIQARKISGKLLTFAEGGQPIAKVMSLKELLDISVTHVLGGSCTRVHVSCVNPDLQVEVDETQMSRAFEYLLLRVIQTIPDEGEVNIDVDQVNIPKDEELKLKSYVKISVEFPGTDMLSANKERVFQPIYSNQENYQGLGLTIIQSIIKAHDGKIELLASENMGTMFVIYLPAFKQNLLQQEENKEKLNISGGTILFMDDDTNIHWVMNNLLKRLNFAMISAYHGEEAVEIYSEMIEENPPDLVILDLTIPGKKGGQETVIDIRAINSNQKIIVSSGYSTVPVMANYEKFGFDGVIPKPYNLDKLAKELHRVLRN